MDEELLRRVPVSFFWHDRGMMHHVAVWGAALSRSYLESSGCDPADEKTMRAVCYHAAKMFECALRWAAEGDDRDGQGTAAHAAVSPGWPWWSTR